MKQQTPKDSTPNDCPPSRRNCPVITPASGGTGTVRATARSGACPVAENSSPVPVSSLSEDYDICSHLGLPHLELAARPAAVSQARHYAKDALWDLGLKEFIEPVELVVSELVTNAVRASGGLEELHPRAGAVPAVRLWLVIDECGIFVFVWDADAAMPRLQEQQPGAMSGRGLFIVETLSVAWGAVAVPNKPGKVVWALCQA